MFTIIVLTCALYLDISDCQMSTAKSHVTISSEMQSPVMCAIHGQAFVARLLGSPPEGFQYKIMCVKTLIGKGNVG